MPLGLLKYGLRRSYPVSRDIPAARELKPAYDVVIIGAGGHGLSTAYHLARHHGITNVCVLDKGYLGGGNTARNTAVIRSNYITPESVRFYKEVGRSLSKAWRTSSTTIMMYSQRGQLTLAHSDATDPHVPPCAPRSASMVGTGIEMVDLQQIARDRAHASRWTRRHACRFWPACGTPDGGTGPPRRGCLGLRGKRAAELRRRAAPAYRGHRAEDREGQNCHGRDQSWDRDRAGHVDPGGRRHVVGDRGDGRHQTADHAASRCRPW